METQSEELLVERVRSGSDEEREAAFAEVHRRLSRGLQLVCRRMLGNAADADDALQETFLAIYRALPAFRGTSALSTWAYRIAVRVALREKARKRGTSSAGLEVVVARQGEDTPGRDELAGALDRAVAALRPEYRTVFSLCCIEELGRQQVAAILGIPEGTVWTRLHRARKELAVALAAWLNT